jgi:hypothetical protein
MTRSKAKTFLEDASRNERFSGRAGVRQDGQKCLVCGARIGGGEPTFHVRGVVVHMRCAVYGRRLVRR